MNPRRKKEEREMQKILEKEAMEMEVVGVQLWCGRCGKPTSAFPPATEDDMEYGCMCATPIYEIDE